MTKIEELRSTLPFDMGPQYETEGVFEMIAEGVCLGRVSARPEACGEGAIGYHAIGEPGKCEECQLQALKIMQGDRG